jgi:hypothetical protein
MSESLGQDTASSENRVKQHLDNAVTEQEAASGNLEQYHRPAAMDNQEKAIEELNAALESMSRQGQQDQQAEKQGDQQEQQQQASSSEGLEHNNEEQGEEQASIEQFSDDADDILEEEKENRRQRDLRALETYKEVERDW